MIDQLLSQAARQSPKTPFVVGATGSFTYEQAAEAAKAQATVLRRRGLRRLGIHAFDSPRLIVLLCAAAAADCEVCLLNRDYAAAEVADVLKRFELGALAVDSELTIDGVEVLKIDELFAESKSARGDSSPSTNVDPRLIVLTTGTTGPPKGARYTWASLAAQARRKDNLAGTRWLLAYHMNHFAGLQVFVHVLVNRATLVIPASPQVSDAITAMIDNQVEYVSATPTFWRFLLAQLGPGQAQKLPLRQITLGGEAVPADLLKMLAENFPNARVSQIFATTEVGSCFSVRDMTSGLPASLLDRPSDESGVQMKIVDGELHIRSPHGMLGYYGDAETHEPVWRSTGDLVEVRGDRIYFVGRKSETINVGGVKVHPLPIEELVQKVGGVAAVHCYGKRNPVAGQLVALDVVPAEGVDREKLEADIRTACESLSRHAQPRIIRFVDALAMANRKVLRRSS